MLFRTIPTYGQNLLNIINKSEKAALTIEGYSDANRINDIASGFFISADGLAVTKASIFYNSDSLIIKLRNGKILTPQKIIAVHPYANLAIIKVERQRRQKDFAFLQTSRSTISASREVLIFCDPSNVENGITVEKIKKTGDFLLIRRHGFIAPNLGPGSFGAPAITPNGKVIGIYGSDEEFFSGIIFSSHILNDSLWVNVNIDINDKTSVKNAKNILTPYLNHGILFYLSDKYAEAARAFSKQIKIEHNSYLLYCLRALARYKYNNTQGGNSDIESAFRLKPDCFLAHYVRGLHFHDTGNNKEAYKNFEECIKINPAFTPAKVEHARLEWKLYNNIRKAFDEFNDVIEQDSLNGDAFYERARLSLQFSSNKELAFEDLNRAIYLDPSLPGVFSLRGIMKLSNHDFQNAISDFTKAIEYNKNDVHAYFNRAVAYFNIGMKKNACKDWQKAGDLGNYAAFKYISRYCSGANSQKY
ncbi:MAG: tetratricopeptide repeat protein [Chlorobi bacterium]|nr:tetratricopeptide repeat protein [Chlorobiota bacterium]